MKLVRTVNSTYNEVDRNLSILEREGIVTQRYRWAQTQNPPEPYERENPGFAQTPKNSRRLR